MLSNLTKETIAYIMEGYEGVKISLDDFFTLDILIKTDMVMDACYPSWSDTHNLNIEDQHEVLRLIKLCKENQ